MQDLFCIGQAFFSLEICRGREIGCPCGLMTVCILGEVIDYGKNR